MAITRFVALLAIGVSAPAQSQEEPEDVIVGKWRISQNIPSACQVITRASDRLTLTALIVKDDRRTHLVLESDIWNLAEGQKLPGEISWDGWESSQPVTSTAQTIVGRKGINTLIGEWPPHSNGQPNHIWIRIPQIYLSVDFVIGDQNVVSAIDDCLTQ